MNDSQSGTVTVNRFPTATPAASSISATERPASIDTMLAKRIAVASSAARARSLTAHLQDVVLPSGRGHQPLRAVRREPHRACPKTSAFGDSRSRGTVHRPDGHPPHRRHLRALPPVLRQAPGHIRRRAVRRGHRRAASVLQMIEEGATHIGVATDHVDRVVPQRSLARDTRPAAGVDPALSAQFQPLEQALAAMGVRSGR